MSYFEQPLVARWEASKNHWRLDGFTDIKFDESKYLIIYEVSRLMMPYILSLTTSRASFSALKGYGIMQNLFHISFMFI